MKLLAPHTSTAHFVLPPACAVLLCTTLVFLVIGVTNNAENNVVVPAVSLVAVVDPEVYLAAAAVVAIAATTVIANVAVTAPLVRVHIPAPLPNVSAHVI